MHSAILLISVVLVVVSAKSIEETSREETETERIIRGRDAASGQFPWVAALFYDGQFICTSSIISPTTVLTAAHCVVLNGQVQAAEKFYAIANVSKSASSVRIEFSSVTPHPMYNDQQIDNDVAVFKTAEAIPVGNDVKPICIAGPNSRSYAKERAIAMGWGNTSPIRFFTNIPDKLQYVNQIVIPNSGCSIFNAGVTEDKVCATGLFSGVCNGDSGGPLVFMSEDNAVQIGITSYINALIGCGKTVPAVWTRVSSFYDFIMQAAGDSSICTA